VDARSAYDPSDDLLADEVPDLDFPLVRLAVLLKVDVDGETSARQPESRYRSTGYPKFQACTSPNPLSTRRNWSIQLLLNTSTSVWE
jgi:hypothetical protein